MERRNDPAPQRTDVATVALLEQAVPQKFEIPPTAVGGWFNLFLTET